ncbi:MAG TPA: hypothetical protein ENI49_06415, partial [Thermoplasmatales archaeon]|nr:hypothetical protein [Thermoplasmatales archaeon]
TFLVVSYADKSKQDNSGRIIYVDDNNTEGPWDGSVEYPYQRIQDAVDNASDGDIIFVFNGQYKGFVARKRLNIVGEDNENTTIKIYWSNEKIWLKADSITFTNFKVTGNYIGWQNAHLEAMGNNIIISNCKFYANNADVALHAGGEYWYTGDYYKDCITISNSTFQDAGMGIQLYLARRCVIENCTFYNNYVGVEIMDFVGKDAHHHIYNCDFYKNKYGICIHETDYNYICNCTILNNSMGFFINLAEGNYITSSLISGNNLGVGVYRADEEWIIGNEIRGNKGGIKFDQYSEGSYVHHNNFVNNTNYNAKDEGNNFWDDGNEGNYWDNYTGVDGNNDGIGDTPYIVSGDNVDEHPLMQPVSMQERNPSSPWIDGEEWGKQWVEYTFSVLATDPNFDSLFYFFDWGDGTNSGWVGPFCHGIEGSVEHKWTEPGTYYIRAKARDVTGREGNWSRLFIVNIEENSRPERPIFLDPPSVGIVGYSVNFSVVSVDKDSEQVKFYIHWGDPRVNHPDEWTSYYDSGEIVNLSHVWGDWYNKIKDSKTFMIKIKAQDINGADSEWTTINITIKNNPPLAPIILDAPTTVKVGGRFRIKVTSSDPDNHKIAYEVDWGGPGWLSTNIFVESGTNYSIDSVYGGYYGSPGVYTIRIRAYDYYGATGPWISYNITVKTPPTVKICKPLKYSIYIRNRWVLPFICTLIFSWVDIKVTAFDKTGIEKVEFYVDNELKAIDTDSPYKWTWDDKNVSGKHVIKAIGYDNAGLSESDEITVWKFF